MKLPWSIQEIAEVIGEENAVHLIKSLPTYNEGGTTRTILYVPKSLKPNHRLVEILGWETASKLVEGFGGEILKPANANSIERRDRDALIVRLANDDMKPVDISKAVNITARQVRNILRRRETPGEELRAANDA
ncbi:hypothetical protein [Sphingopyxis sp.]|uniref:hypothetical protein n=1 Tax=Sphingopyxis sp. TaxID=1908224 RepID=UPI004035F790